MRDYKLLLAGLILLLLILFIAVFTWLWVHNRKNIDPLPIMANENDPTTITDDDDENTIADNILYMQIEENLQTPLKDIIVSFESRYPYIQVLANYVPSQTLLKLSDTTSNSNERADFAVGIDMIIANDSLSKERLAPLQAELKTAQDKLNQNQANVSNVDENAKDNTTKDTANSDKIGDTETRILNSFSYTLRDEQALEGVILTDNTAAVNFRNFLLSSAGQDMLKKHGYHNIEGYKNSVNDLFNPTSQAKIVSGDTSVDVADALSNGK